MNIISKGHDGNYILMHKNQPVQAGQVITNHRGTYIVLGGSAPHKLGSTGRVNVRDGIVKHPAVSDQSFFPGVIDCEWVKQ